MEKGGMGKQRILNDNELRYRMCVAGAFSGLITWFIGVWIPFVVTLPEGDQRMTLALNRSLLVAILGMVPKDDHWIIEVLDSTLMGLFIGTFYVVLISRLLRDDNSGAKTFERILIGASGGSLAGALGVVMSFRPRWLWLSGWPRIGVVVAWSLTGCCLGLLIGLIRYKWFLRYVFLSMAGGLIGATLGCFVLLVGGEFVPHFRSVGLILTAMFICLFSTSAVTVARRATLKFLDSKDPAVEQLFRGREWDLLQNVTYVFGSNLRPHVGVHIFNIQIKDRRMWDRHALIEWSEGAFRVRPSDENSDQYGTPIQPLEAGNPTAVVKGKHELKHGQEILMGQTRFLFLLRGKMAMIVFGFILSVFVGRVVHAQGNRSLMVSAERIQVLRIKTGSETVVFRVPLNIVNSDGEPQKISVFRTEEISQRVSVTEGASELRKTCHVEFGSLPRRYAILLVDVSGSMQERVGDSSSKTKFEVMKEACLKFAADFVHGVDYVAVIPFESHHVMERIRESKFFDNQEELQQHINTLPEPTSQNNTALFSAVMGALAKLKDVQNNLGSNAQYLLVVLTDGKNDLRRGDDKDLEASPDPVRDFEGVMQLPVLTIGFGNDQNLKEDDLKKLAWENPINYRRARSPEDLVGTFQRARSLQLDRVYLTFQPQPDLLSQLVSPHTYRIRFLLDDNRSAEGFVTWQPDNLPLPQGVLASEAGRCLPASMWRDWLTPFLIFFSWLGLLTYLWFRPPRGIKRSWEDEEIDRVWTTPISDLSKQLWKS
jgi:hypothetical protein